MRNVMVDLETMGKTPGCAIVSIGAVKFDPIAGRIGDEFYRVVSLESSMAMGLRVDASTVMWWMRQSDAARLALTDNPAETMHLATVLQEFRSFFSLRENLIWGHGASFDPPILEAAYRAAGTICPWDSGSVRDTRTLYEAADHWPVRDPAKQHHALEDARVQAQAVIEAYRHIRGVQGARGAHGA